MFHIKLFFLYLLFPILVLIILLIPITLRIKIHNLRNNNNILFSLNVMLFGRQIFFLDNMYKKERRYSSLFFIKLLGSQSKSAAEKIHMTVNFLNRLIRAIKWHNMLISIKIGTGDPAATGIAIGLLYVVRALFLVRIKQQQLISKINPQIFIYPSFLEKGIKFYLAAEFSIVLGCLLFNVIFPLSLKKEAARQWQNSIPSRI